MDNCPKCGNHHLRKDGVVGGRQRYFCKTCGFHPTVLNKSDRLTPEEKTLALGMHKEGLSFRAVGRILKTSHVAILKLVHGQEGRFSSPPNF